MFEERKVGRSDAAYCSSFRFQLDSISRRVLILNSGLGVQSPDALFSSSRLGVPPARSPQTKDCPLEVKINGKDEGHFTFNHTTTALRSIDMIIPSEHVQFRPTDAN
jgi:hypothetical protein